MHVEHSTLFHLDVVVQISFLRRWHTSVFNAFHFFFLSLLSTRYKVVIVGFYTSIYISCILLYVRCSYNILYVKKNGITSLLLLSLVTATEYFAQCLMVFDTGKWNDFGTKCALRDIYSFSVPPRYCAAARHYTIYMASTWTVPMQRQRQRNNGDENK